MRTKNIQNKEFEDKCKKYIKEDSKKKVPKAPSKRPSKIKKDEK